MFKLYRPVLTFVLLWSLLGGVLAHAAPVQQQNLLTNPSLEGPLGPQDGIPQVQVASGWRAWWNTSPRAESWQNLRPEWSESLAKNYPERVHHGEKAMRYFKGWSTFTAGAFQVVSGITPGTQLTFTAWGQAWSCKLWDNCHEEQEGSPPKVWSDSDALVHMKIGIDPNGGTNANSGSIVWSQEGNPLDRWMQFSVTATAAADKVTVFFYASQDWPAENQDAYWDDAALVAVGQGQAPSGGSDDSGGGTTQQPASAEVPFVRAVGEANAEGNVIHKVEAQDTVLSIAYAYRDCGSSRANIEEWNGLSGQYWITPGQELIVCKNVEPGEGAESGGASEEAAEGESAEEGDTAEAGGASEEAPGVEGAESGGESGGGESSGGGAGSVDVSGEAPPALAQIGQVCAALYHDANANRIQEGDEPALSGGTLVLEKDMQVVDQYVTAEGELEHCFEGLQPGEYKVRLELPAGYGATTGISYAVTVAGSQTKTVSFGAAPGFDDSPPPAAEGIEEEEENPFDDAAAQTEQPSFIEQYGGLVLFGAAGVMLLVGVVIFFLRR